MYFAANDFCLTLKYFLVSRLTCQTDCQNTQPSSTGIISLNKSILKFAFPRVETDLEVKLLFHLTQFLVASELAYGTFHKPL